MIAVLPLLGACPGSQVPPGNNQLPPTGGGPGQPVTFANGGFQVSAKTVQSGGSSTTTVDQAGQTLVEASATVDGVTMSFPTQGGSSASIVFNTPLSSQPSEFAMNRLAVFVAGQLFGVGGAIPRDNPGCDMFPDTRCTLRCCADHDRCYAENGCTALSWLTTVFLPGSFEVNACANCNAVAAQCIVFGCASSDEGDPSTDVCFDAACGANYTCPPPNEFDCYACSSPCSNSPSTCGNGNCELGETTENCASDCATGLGVNVCCAQSGNCPTETADSCPGDCCCCGLGETCGDGQICRPTGGGGSGSVGATPVTP
ncbi:MAG: hypothetical protein HY287_10355 [Planctomycetes bacterium]|nr:hypothetical protein [Planctomycetota bacterium]